jgi:hypothetical protein
MCAARNFVLQSLHTKMFLYNRVSASGNLAMMFYLEFIFFIVDFYIEGFYSPSVLICQFFFLTFKTEWFTRPQF